MGAGVYADAAGRQVRKREGGREEEAEGGRIEDTIDPERKKRYFIDTSYICIHPHADDDDNRAMHHRQQQQQEMEEAFLEAERMRNHSAGPGMVRPPSQPSPLPFYLRPSFFYFSLLPPLTPSLLPSFPPSLADVPPPPRPPPPTPPPLTAAARSPRVER